MPGDIMDYGGLAARLAVNIGDVRACLLMSRDGLTLGVYPREQETMARSVWDRLQSIGDPERGFLVVRDELWILARRGPYVGVVVASATATPGLLLDRLEFTLRAAEELRMQEGSATLGSRTDAARRPRTPLHPEPAPEPAARPAEVRSARAVPEPEPVAPMLDLSTPPAPPQAPPTPEPVTSGDGGPTTAHEATPAEGELDPVKAAMDFAAMTGAVGVVPTMTPKDAPSPPDEDAEPTPWGPDAWKLKEPDPVADREPAPHHSKPDEEPEPRPEATQAPEAEAEPGDPEVPEAEVPEAEVAEPEPEATEPEPQPPPEEESTEPEIADPELTEAEDPEAPEAMEAPEAEAAAEPFAPPLQPLPMPEEPEDDEPDDETPAAAELTEVPELAPDQLPEEPEAPEPTNGAVRHDDAAEVDPVAMAREFAGLASHKDREPR